MGENCCGGGSCGTGQENMPSAHHVAFDAHYKIDGLIRLMVKKGLITESEYEEAMNELITELRQAHEAQAKAMQEQFEKVQAQANEENKEE